MSGIIAPNKARLSTRYVDKDEQTRNGRRGINIGSTGRLIEARVNSADTHGSSASGNAKWRVNTAGHIHYWLDKSENMHESRRGISIGGPLNLRQRQQDTLENEDRKKNGHTSNGTDDEARPRQPQPFDVRPDANTPAALEPQVQTADRQHELSFDSYVTMVTQDEDPLSSCFQKPFTGFEFVDAEHHLRRGREAVSLGPAPVQEHSDASAAMETSLIWPAAETGLKSASSQKIDGCHDTEQSCHGCHTHSCDEVDGYDSDGYDSVHSDTEECAQSSPIKHDQDDFRILQNFLDHVD